MFDAKIWVWTALLFVFVVIKFTLLSPIWLIYATYRYIDQNGLEGIGKSYETIKIAFSRAYQNIFNTFCIIF